MGMHVLDTGILAKFSQARLNATYLQATMGSMKRNEQSGRVVLAQFEICEQMHLSSGIKIDPPFLVALAVNHAFTRIEIDIPPVELHKLANPNTRRREQINHRQIANLPARVAKKLKRLV